MWINDRTGERRESMPPELDAMQRTLVADTVRELQPDAMHAKNDGMTAHAWAGPILDGAWHGYSESDRSKFSELAFESVGVAVMQIVSAVWGVDASFVKEPLRKAGGSDA